MSLSDLSQQVGNMLHMMNQLQALQQQQEEAASSNQVVWDEQAMYDVPRNVQSAPLQRDKPQQHTKYEDNVWDSLLAPKTPEKAAAPKN